jgi:hypothetical protein
MYGDLRPTSPERTGRRSSKLVIRLLPSASTARPAARGGSRPRAPRVWLQSPRFFTPYRPTRTRQESHAPSLNGDRQSGIAGDRASPDNPSDRSRVGLPETTSTRATRTGA